ncbi:helix-turn-helix domain-containing protein [Streptomyces sp. NPDC059070]|uniref:helix-turn-helix domain-containing protein n=1 Tax=Streptomyces sp. NPDC059070 TaxID=3346713 RepID=UPI0036C061BD
MTQEDLAHACHLSVDAIRAAERDVRLTLPTLLAVSAALHCDVSVILGQSTPRRATTHADRVIMTALSHAIHDTSAGRLPETLDEPPTVAELSEIVTQAWSTYWTGQYAQVGALAAPLVREAAARLHVQPDGEQASAWAVLADAYRISAYVANLMGARDLAYAAIGHAHHATSQAADPLRAALVDSGRAWVYLRDARLADALDLAEKAATDIEPRFSKASHEELTVYGSHINFAAVVASRMANSDRAADYLSQSHAAGARMGREHGAFGTLFGPVTATTQAVGIKVSLGETGQALDLIDSIGDVSQLQKAAQHRYAMDKALAQADARMWDSALDTLEGALEDAPEWARHQALPGVIAEKIGAGSTARLRKVSRIIGVSPVPREGTGFPAADRRTAL